MLQPWLRWQDYRFNDTLPLLVSEHSFEPLHAMFFAYFLTATSCQDGVYRSPKSVLNSNAFVAQILLIEPTVYFVFSFGKDLHSR